VPIVVLSARHDERSKVEALDLGADDYVSKPFGMDELMARLRAALRHAFQAQGELPVFVSGDLTVDLIRRHVTCGGQEVKLSPKEFDLLRHLVMHAGKVLTHRHLLREVWGPAQAEEVQYLRVFIRGLRQKLEPDPTRPTHILTELALDIACNCRPSSAPERDAVQVFMGSLCETPFITAGAGFMAVAADRIHSLRLDTPAQQRELGLSTGSSLTIAALGREQFV
jgi:hypothetical protein